jgi:hypothetical protein
MDEVLKQAMSGDRMMDPAMMAVFAHSSCFVEAGFVCADND